MVNNTVNLHCKIPVFWSITIIPTYLVFQMYANPPAKSLIKFQKEKEEFVIACLRPP